MTTVLDTIDKGTRYLESRGIEDARRNMQMLVAHQLGLNRIELYMQFDRPMQEDELAPLRDMLKKRGQRVPLQHLLGRVEFFNREFICDSRGLIPRPETEELVELILKENLPAECDVLDLGTGSGVLGLTLAAELAEKCHQLTCADISPDALALAGENAAELELDGVEFIHTDLFDQLAGRRFHLIAANLPYVEETDRPSLTPEVMHDPELALFSGADGLDLLRRFCKEARNYLHPGGIVALEIGHRQGPALESLLLAEGFTNVRVHKDMSGIARFPIAHID
ncbi:peptide chain release factor N(5)-glutamine methyltransferase [Persicirhabdus sediminis]|uniref:Release factor glutamine methyltransferase n=1 Tax=Persicirhabdus sediminis TaxID=454144 RepID=A0A8J7MC27_9BACT|nr:peptide chain release factor N(5)-glutamine methyltransferase [Persicirhabdus sediminis]MBK1790362.1 peptide chain release factor N(5)-glutamine methyltransferase [Persicirhabdus sediminis]